MFNKIISLARRYLFALENNFLSVKLIRKTILFFILLFFCMSAVNVFAGEDEIKWTYKTKYGISSPPAIGLDGTVYFVDRKTLTTSPTFTYGSNLYAFNPDGTLKWKLTNENNKYYYHSPAIGPDGTIYVFDYTTLIALTPEGEIKWKFVSEVYNLSIGKDGTLFPSGYYGLSALTPEGNIKWRHFTIRPCTSMNIIGKDGTIYVNTGLPDYPYYDIYAINPDGTLKWKNPAKKVYGSAIGSDGTLYVSLSNFSDSKPTEFLAYNPDGTIKFKNNYSIDNFLVSNSGLIYTSENSIIGSDGNIYSMPGKTVLSSDGMMYYGDSIGNIVAVQTDLKGYQEGAPWPCRSHDARNTFCADSTVYYSVTGILLHNGIPVPNLSFKIGDYEIHTDEQGNYSVFLKDGTYTVSINSNENITEILVSGSDIALDINLPETEGNLKWKFFTRPKTAVSPAIGPDGTIYAYDYYPQQFSSLSYLYAINSDGNTKWRGIISGSINNILSIDSGGVVLLTSTPLYFSDHYLSSINPDGTKNEKFSFIIEISKCALGVFYYFHFGKLLTIVNSDGTIKQKIENVVGQPFIGSNGSVYFNNNNGINCLLTDGAIKNIGTSGTILALGKNNTFYAMEGVFNSDGSLRWNYPIPGVKECVVNDEEVVYAVENSKYSEYLYAINPDGSLKWRYRDDAADTNLIKGLCVGADGVVYFVNKINSDSYIYAVNPDGSFCWKFKTDNYIPDKIYPLLDKNGALYIIDSAGTLYSIQTSSYGYQKDAPWPCYGHDNGHTFNAGTVFTAVEEENAENSPAQFLLLQNYPNPFNPITTISYSVPKSDHVSLNVYSISGQKVATLVNGFVNSGKHEVIFDGSELASGVYLYRFEAGGFSKSGRMLLMK